MEQEEEDRSGKNTQWNCLYRRFAGAEGENRWPLLLHETMANAERTNNTTPPPDNQSKKATQMAEEQGRECSHRRLHRVVSSVGEGGGRGWRPMERSRRRASRHHGV